jgi:hypothetical protein
MVDAGYNTNSELRAIAGMGTSVPTDTVLDHWIELIDAVIEAYDPSPGATAAVVEANRISLLYWNLKHDTDPLKEQTLKIAPLSMDEKEMLGNANNRSVWWS